MLSIEKIRAKREKLKERIAISIAKTEALRAEMKALQCICPHPNPVTSHDSGWGRMPSDYWDCPDCGKHKST